MDGLQHWMSDDDEAQATAARQTVGSSVSPLLRDYGGQRRHFFSDGATSPVPVSLLSSAVKKLSGERSYGISGGVGELRRQ